MAYNLDFSGWQDARRAQAQSILNNADIAANLIAHKADVLNKTISTGIDAAARAYKKKKEKEEADALNQQDSAVPDNVVVIEGGFLPETPNAPSIPVAAIEEPVVAPRVVSAGNEFAMDPMQAASANNELPTETEEDKIIAMMRKLYGDEYTDRKIKEFLEKRNA